jgi:hypothetical protein
VTITVSNSAADTTPPAVSITSPTSGATVSSIITLTATASDPDSPIAFVQFLLDGANLGPQLTSSPYSFSWNTSTVANGAHTLTAVARDPSGNQGTSTALTVTVSNSTGTGTPTLVWSVACEWPQSFQGGWSSTPEYPCYFPEPAIAGNTIIFAFGYDNTGNNQSFTVTDDKNDPLNLAVTSATGGNGGQVRIYTISNVTAGATYIKIHLNSGSTKGDFTPKIAEFYNAGAVDATGCNSGSTTAISSGSIAPTVSGDLIYQYSYDDLAGNPGTFINNSFTAGSQANITWALLDQLLGDSTASQYGIYNSTTPFTPSFTQGTANSFVSCAVTLKPGSSGSAPTGTHIVHLEHDSMWHTQPNPWKMGMVSTGDVIYISRVGNDPVTSVTSSPAPDVTNWTASGADFNGLNGHNHVNVWCAKFSSPPGPLTITMTRTDSGADDIKLIYDVKGGTCNLDVDSGGQAGNQGSQVPNLTVCSGCLTPTQQNDFILFLGGQGFCTVTSWSAPTGVIQDNDWNSGNPINGSTPTDENNGWAHFYNGTSLAPITATWGEACDTAQQHWASRVVAYRSF